MIPHSTVCLEAAILIGITVLYANQHSTWGVAVAGIALIGSQLVSYIRAKAEALNINCEVGVFTRPETDFFQQALQRVMAALEIPDCISRHQCNVRGMVRVKGAISASKWVPSSASI